PDIFGSMMQAVVQPGQRESLGMHYTSVENIMKVIRPLFLDELEDAFRAADTVRKLDNLLERIARIKLFDPACGSGNFLVIGYKELRKLEHRILVRIRELEPSRATLFANSVIKLERFYGIEIDDFAHEIAILSLYLAKHQMNVEFRELFAVEIALIPLRDTGNITCGNATRVDWNDACPVGTGDDVYVLGNPPYLGGRSGDTSVNDYRADREAAFFPIQPHGFLDYVGAWFIKAARYIQGRNMSAAFVSTNSVCQGVQVGALWPHIFDTGAVISFAHTSFKWTNQAKGNAGVSVAIICISSAPSKSRMIYTDGMRKEVPEISPYLTAGSQRAIVEACSSSISGLPDMTTANQPTDDGNLLLTRLERDELVAAYPEAASFIRRYVGAAEYLGGKERFCLWISDADVSAASRIPPIAERINRVRAFRSASKSSASRSVAGVPWRFHRIRHRPGSSIIIPAVSSERREDIPMGFLDDNTIISNLANAIYDAEPWIFGLIQSRLHMVWTRALAGRLKTDLRYSAGGCYNTFPIPQVDDVDKDSLTEFTFGILEAREHHPEKTLAQMYDPDKMPADLRRAHEQLDEAVERLYRTKPFSSDDERLEHLFDMYEAMVKEPANA
ncbi:MAG: class I SAM-dependent DNA methyltransferase, partial [Thermoleophilia bacterium]|nr:class I SAM-dependent DNA methyltransferase [Thermoleophilia bacterium]